MNKNLENPLLPKRIFPEGILLLNKPKGKTSFSLVALLRKLTGIKKIGHAGTLDPFATGVMVMLIGKSFTRLSSQFLDQEKQYLATLQLGISTDTWDCDGKILKSSDKIPLLSEIEEHLKQFQGKVKQIPPMFSAKKIKGKKLYELARRGIEIERKAEEVTLEVQIISYQYPYLELNVTCSKGTYIRSIAHDLGVLLETGAHVCKLTRLRSGPFRLEECLDIERLIPEELPRFLRTSL